MKGRDFRDSVRRIQRHNILVVGSFIIGLDIDEPGIGQQIAEVANRFGLDNLNTLFLTPLPGTRLWDQMRSEDRIALDAFPDDWRYYTLTFPVAQYKGLSLDEIIQEMVSCNRSFYSLPRILRRVWGNLWHHRQPLISLVGNLLLPEQHPRGRPGLRGLQASTPRFLSIPTESHDHPAKLECGFG